MGPGEEVETEFYIRVVMRWSHWPCLFPLCEAEVNEVLPQGLINCCSPGAWRCSDESGEEMQKPVSLREPEEGVLAGGPAPALRETSM